MKLHEILQPKETRSLAEILKQDCKPFFAQNLSDVDYWMLRGMQGISRYEYEVDHEMDTRIDWAILHNPINRTPKDTPKDYHKMADDFFAEEFGWRARSQGVFVSGSRKMAELFGRLHIIVPIGYFHFLWSPKISDMTKSVFNYVDSHIADGIQNKGEEKGLSPQEIDKLVLQGFKTDILEKAQYTDENLKKGIQSENEIMLRCESYIAIQMPDRARDIDFIEAIFESAK
jgi:hypothetical protein